MIEETSCQEPSGISALRMLYQHYRSDFLGDSFLESLKNAPLDIDLDGKFLDFIRQSGFAAKEYKDIPFDLIAEAVDKGMPPMIKGKIGVIRGDSDSKETGYVLVSGYQRDGSKSYYSFGIIDPILKKKHQVTPEQFCEFWNHVSEKKVDNIEEIFSMILVFPPDREPPF